MTQKEAQKKLRNCKFWPNSMEEQKQILKKLKEAGYFFTGISIVNTGLVSIFTNENRNLTFDFGYDPKFFINSKKKQVNINDLLKLEIKELLEPKDFEIVTIKSNNWADAFLFQSIFATLQSYTQAKKNFALFMEAGEALAASLNLIVIFSIKGKTNPGIGWNSYNYLNPWINFFEQPLKKSKCSAYDIIEFLKTFPIKSELKIVYNG